MLLNKPIQLSNSLEQLCPVWNSIKQYWEIYEIAYPNLFSQQIQKDLGLNGYSKSIEALEHTLIRIKAILGGAYWE
ncbi:MAG: hypothetical protein V4598_16510 [Bdellovibrionota bacterium]